MKSKIELNDNQVDAIIVYGLVRSYESTCQSIADLKEIQRNQILEDYEIEDLEYDKKIKKSLYRVIKHFTTEHDFLNLGLSK